MFINFHVIVFHLSTLLNACLMKIPFPKRFFQIQSSEGGWKSTKNIFIHSEIDWKYFDGNDRRCIALHWLMALLENIHLNRYEI